MTKINDKDGFAGRYISECGKVWTVTKFYLGKGIGARWTIEGPFFSGDFLNYAAIADQVKDWTEAKVSRAS